MKTRVLSIFLILLLCLTAGCGKASQNTEKPDGFSFSESQTEEAAGKDTSQAEQTAPAQPPEAQSAQTADEETEGSAESERRRQAIRSKRRTSPSVGRKPQLHRLHPKQNSPSLRQPRNRSRQNLPSRHNHPRSRPPSRPLTSATGSTLPRAMPKAWG